MKVQYYSDLHIDINRLDINKIHEEADLYIDAGDTGDVFTTIQTYSSVKKPTIIVAGNHTYYNNFISDCNYMLDNNLPNNVLFLNNKCEKIGDYLYIGCTLWTNFNLYMDRPNFNTLLQVCNSINDFRCIKENFGYISVNSIRRMFNDSLRYLRKTLDKYKKEKCIVITHHAPSYRSCLDKYLYDPITRAFASNLDGFILGHPNIKYWIHGHVHNTVNYNIGTTKVLCNPFGYQSENEDYKSRFL